MSGRTAPMRTSSTRVVSSVVPGCTPISRSCRQSSGRVMPKPSGFLGRHESGCPIIGQLRCGDASGGDGLDLDDQVHVVADERFAQRGAEAAALQVGLEIAAADVAREHRVMPAGE